MFYIHNVPGRLRIRSEAVKNNPSAANSVKISLSSMPGIGVVDINLVTGGILIHYNKKTVNYRDIVSLLERNGYIDRSRAITNNDQFLIAPGIGKTIFKTMTSVLIGKVLADTPLSILVFLV
jgi:hypothetical protein